MQNLPPIVLECPECGEQYLISRESYTPSEEATLFSDGYFIDNENWRTPEIIGCVTCELGFFRSCGKLVAEPDWDEFQEKWSKLKKAEPPTAGSLALELRARKNMTLEVEKALRKEFWYSGNHTETGRMLMSKNKKFKTYWNESLEKYVELLSDSEEDLHLKAECHRQLGNFELCIQLISHSNSALAKAIVAKAEQKDSKVFQLNN